ncbi:uncharacterized protein LOC110989675 [Acanthaster planci]|uniref:Leucine-rich repeat-containing protein 41 n=1 Tax=Acanthaster planci TaxID=133434 RepID=A0A8B7ZWY3_ACAPL|nr:uncharacterized protein LOC110989675 [Acanthaster planci]
MDPICPNLKFVCLDRVAEFIANNHIQIISFLQLQAFPSRLLRDLVPRLNVCGLARLHQVLQGKGIAVQEYWLKHYHQAFDPDNLARHCSCHDSSLASVDWRQRLLDKRCEQELQELRPINSDRTEDQDSWSLKILDILQNPLLTHGPLDDFFPSSLLLQSRLLPYIQRNEEILEILQKNMRELVLAHYLPKYESILRKFLECLIHHGVLRKLTLKHAKFQSPAQLFSILEVCAGRRDSTAERSHEDAAGSDLKRQSTDGSLPVSKPFHCLRCQSKLSFFMPLYGQKTPVSNTRSHYQLKWGTHQPFCVVGPDLVALDQESDPASQASEYPSVSSQIDLSCNSSCRPSHQCVRTTDPCIKHLVMCGFILHQPDYSQVLEEVFSVWPGLRELELIDNVMLEDSSHKILAALVRAQQLTPSFQRLRIEDNSIQDSNLLLLQDLLARSKLKTLELKNTDISFLASYKHPDVGFGALGQWHPLSDAFSQLSAIDLSHNRLFYLAFLEQALTQPDCTIKLLNLECCELGTEMLDSLFVSAKDSKCLRELNVACNKYCPHTNSRASFSGLAELIRNSPLTKLNLSGCSFALTGWTHGNDFADALRLDSSLHQFLLESNLLTDKCLHLLASAFVNPPTDLNVQAPQLCLDISFNKHITREGLDTFSQTLQKASTTPGYRITPPRHLTITMERGESSTREDWKMAEFMKLTVSRKVPVGQWSNRRGGYRSRRYVMNCRDLMMEHQSQM